jgi:hypothetical protein
MATGRLGTANITSTANTTIYTVPADTFSVVTVSLCNRGTASEAVRLAVASSATPTDAEYLEFDSELLAKGVLERTGIVMDAGKLLVVSTSTGSATLSVVAMGIETATA